MIQIHKSETADSKTATSNVTKEQLLKSSEQHINDVRKAMDYFIHLLDVKGIQHDYTKITDIDSFFDSFQKSLENKQLGKENTFTKEPWFQKHITQERHHVCDYCPDDVNLLDLLERIADIVMAGMGRSGDVYPDRIPDYIIVKAYHNTVELLKSKVEVIDD